MEKTNVESTLSRISDAIGNFYSLGENPSPTQVMIVRSDLDNAAKHCLLLRQLVAQLKAELPKSNKGRPATTTPVAATTTETNGASTPSF